MKHKINAEKWLCKHFGRNSAFDSDGDNS